MMAQVVYILSTEDSDQYNRAADDMAMQGARASVAMVWT